MLHFKKTILLSLAIISVFSLSSYAYAVWNDPTATPPGNNTPTPINVGTTAQVKSGNFGLGNITTFPAKLNISGDTGGKPISMFHPSQNGQFEWQFDNSGVGNIDRLRFNKTGNFGSTGSIGDILSFDFFGNVGIGSAPFGGAKLSINGVTNINSGGLSVFGNTYLGNNLGVGTSTPGKKVDVLVNSDSDGIRLKRSDNSTGFSINAGGWTPWIDYVGITGHSDLWFVPKASYSNLGVWQSTTTAPASFRISGLGTASYVGARSYCDIDGDNCFTADEVGGGGGNFWAPNATNDIYNTNSSKNVGVGTNVPLTTVGGNGQAVLEVNGTSNTNGAAAVVIRAKTGKNPRLFFGTGTGASDASNRPTWVIYQKNSAGGELAVGNHQNNVTALEFSNSATPVTTINYGLKFTGGTPALNKILASDATGLASWKSVSEIPGLGGGGSYSELNWATSTSNPNLMYNKNQASGSTVIVGATTQAVSGSKFEVNGLSIFKGILGLSGTNAVEFGQGVVGKQIDAGKIMYKRYSNGLDIIGAGEVGVARIVKIWDSLIVDTIFATNICSNTTGACNSVTNILNSVGLWDKSGNDVKLAGPTDNLLLGKNIYQAGNKNNLITVSPNGNIKIKKGSPVADDPMEIPVQNLALELQGLNSKMSGLYVNEIDNSDNKPGQALFIKNGGATKLSIAGSVQVYPDTDLLIGATSNIGKLIYRGNGASTGKVLVAKDDTGTAEWQDLPIIYANFTKNPPAWVCGSLIINCQNFYNSDFTRATGSSLITHTVTEPGGIGTRDVVTMTCPSGYKAIAGGVTCNAGGHNVQTNSQTIDGVSWVASCGTELNNISNANITCAKIQ